MQEDIEKVLVSEEELRSINKRLGAQITNCLLYTSDAADE